jgi:trehalose 6-phosphate phosphatase
LAANVVSSCHDIARQEALMAVEREMSAIPLVWDVIDRIAGRFDRARPALFLDYDGTLAPIVSDPDAATAPAATLELLHRLAPRLPIAIVSGRELADLRRRVPVPGVAFAGSHGLEIETADGRRHDMGETFAGTAADAAAALMRVLADFPGVRLERKVRSVAVHVRGAPDAVKPLVRDRVAAVAAAHPRLRVHHGKEVLELQPDLAWDKGRAVLWLAGALDLIRPDVTLLAVGDDRTDEDSFRAVADLGLGVLVADAARPTAASLRLTDPPDAARFLAWIDGRT